MLHEINLSIRKLVKWLEGEKEDKSKGQPTPQPAPAETGEQKPPEKKTALQVVNEMVKARLMQAEVDILNDTGQRGFGTIHSPEFDLLKERGVIVLNVGISNIRLNPTVEEQFIKQWSADWYNTARMESEQIDQKRNILETAAQEEALIEYAKKLSREVNDLAKKEKPNVKGILKTLLLRSRSLIRSSEHSEQLRRRMSTELQEIADMLEWVEANGK
jgi:hypothetical protein